MQVRKREGRIGDFRPFGDWGRHFVEGQFAVGVFRTDLTEKVRTAPILESIEEDLVK